MNLIDALIVAVLVLGLVVTYKKMRRKKGENCSGTCLGCHLETTCRIKNFKEDYDRDQKPRCNCGG